MKKMYHIILISFFLLITSTCLSQQLQFRSSFGNTDFQFNPAMTATGEYMEWGATYRQQWLGFEEAPITGVAYIQYPLVDNNMSIGGSIGYDKAGLLQKNELNINYSYKLELGYSSQLSFGILANLSQQRFDGSAIISNDLDDILFQRENASTYSPNFGFGVFYVSNTRMYDLSESAFYIGIGLNQLLPQSITIGDLNQSNYKKVPHANAIIGGRIINNIGFIEPSLWLNYSVENILYGVANVNFEMEDIFWTGLNIGTDFTVGFQSGIVLKNDLMKDGQLRIGVSGNYNLGSYGSQQGLGFEFLIAYRFEQ
jgi:type IX secretion system PorP/SprF family membrane protein